MENFNAAKDFASVFENSRIAWSDAIKEACDKHGFDIVHLIIKNHAIRFSGVREASKVLDQLCTSSELISKLRATHKFFKSDEDFYYYAQKNIKKISQRLIRIQFSDSGKNKIFPPKEAVNDTRNDSLH